MKIFSEKIRSINESSISDGLLINMKTSYKPINIVPSDALKESIFFKATQHQLRSGLAEIITNLNQQAGLYEIYKTLAEAFNKGIDEASKEYPNWDEALQEGRGVAWQELKDLRNTFEYKIQGRDFDDNIESDNLDRAIVESIEGLVNDPEYKDIEKYILDVNIAHNGARIINLDVTVNSKGVQNQFTTLFGKYIQKSKLRHGLDITRQGNGIICSYEFRM